MDNISKLQSILDLESVWGKVKQGRETGGCAEGGNFKIGRPHSESAS